MSGHSLIISVVPHHSQTSSTFFILAQKVLPVPTGVSILCSIHFIVDSAAARPNGKRLPAPIRLISSLCLSSTHTASQVLMHSVPPKCHQLGFWLKGVHLYREPMNSWRMRAFILIAGILSFNLPQCRELVE